MFVAMGASMAWNGHGADNVAAPQVAVALSEVVRDTVSIATIVALAETPAVSRDHHLRRQGNALALAAALPRLPRQVAVPGGHFVFIDPCSPAIAEATVAICLRLSCSSAVASIAAGRRTRSADFTASLHRACDAVCRPVFHRSFDVLSGRARRGGSVRCAAAAKMRRHLGGGRVSPRPEREIVNGGFSWLS
jgi:hypothetical protein